MTDKCDERSETLSLDPEVAWFAEILNPLNDHRLTLKVTMSAGANQRIERFLGQVIRLGISIFFFTVVAGSSFAAFMDLQVQLKNDTFNASTYWPQALIPLAILIALSGLLYNRARAVGANATKHRFRSMYAAERLLAASCFYLAALATACFASLCGDLIVSQLRIPIAKVWEAKALLFGLALPLLGWSIMEVFHTIRLIAPNGAYRTKFRVARRVHELL